MYDNNSFNFNYDIRVVILNSSTREEVCEFNAREYSQITDSASFAAGGVASGGQNYTIATTADVHDKLVPYAMQAIIDGREFKICNVGYSRSVLDTGLLKKKKFETVIYLG